ncbi:MAG TPA: FGGY family carbohydrate kinase [Cyclobacteriaceae bacterium]|nr:FGGY family carbohydrate kinase [Cyclobacteriaceae bacterium]
MKEYQIAVLDLGKTNKKLVVFDQDLRMLAEEKTVIGEYEENGIKFDNLPEIEKWFIKSLRKFTRTFTNIMSISISTHGATFVCIGADGKPSVPEISYTTDPGDDFHKAFYREFSDRKTLQKQTCTPDFNLLINSGKGIWFAMKKFGREFNRTKHILNFPQYFGYLLTGNVGAEPTYTGCHTYLWDFHKNSWSWVADSMGIIPYLPAKLGKPWDILGCISAPIIKETGLPVGATVTFGIHDSNASLLPYLITMDEDFVLNSTGTWCVMMHEKEKVEFREDELGKVVFYNLNAFSKPVKTSIFMGGLEYESYTGILKKLTGNDRQPSFDYERFSEIIRKRELFILPSVAKGTGQFPDSSPRVIEKGRIYLYDDVIAGKEVPGFFYDYETAWAVLVISLVIQTKISLERADMTDGLPLFIEGGFSNNDAYAKLLTAFYPASDVCITSLNEATAFGAAILSKASLEKIHPMQLKPMIHIDKKRVLKVAMKDIDAYVSDFIRYIEM